MTVKNKICVSACAAPQQGGGLYTFEITADGKLKRLDHLAVDSPMYTALFGETVSVLSRQQDGTNSGLATVQVDAEGRFGPLSAAVSTHGVEACHLCVDAADTYVVNYGSGSVVRLPDTVRTFFGSGPHAQRQEASHTHCVILSPCKNYVLVTDLGTDNIHVLDRALQPVSTAKVPAGHGARHLVFSNDGRYLYCVNELVSSVSVFGWNANTAALGYISTFDSDVPAEIAAQNTAAAIRLSGDGRYLYISNRGEDTVAVFETQDGVSFTLAQKAPCGGSHPRDFQITNDENYLVCANTFSNLVSVFALHDGRIGALTDSVLLPRPLCVMNI